MDFTRCGGFKPRLQTRDNYRYHSSNYQKRNIYVTLNVKTDWV